MDAAEYAGWCAMNTERWGRAKSPCTDCTTEFAAEMRFAGRCDGTPGAVPKHSSPFADSVKRRAYYREKARQARRRAGMVDRAELHASRVAKAHALQATGLSIADIALAMGLHRFTITRYMKEAAA